jgi:4'-phosphopantetheinyl transferase EntD
MSELTPKTTHYIVHSTVVDPLPESTYGTSAPYSGPHALERAVKAAHKELNGRRRAFVTARDDASRILAVIPVVDYPVFGDTHVPEHAQDAITALFEGLDWTV